MKGSYKEKHRGKKPRQDRSQDSRCSAPHIEEALRQQRLNDSTSNIQKQETEEEVETHAETGQPKRIPGFYFDKKLNRYFKLTKEMKAMAKSTLNSNLSSNKKDCMSTNIYTNTIMALSQQDDSWTTHMYKRSIFSTSRSAEAMQYSFQNHFSESVLSRIEQFHILSQTRSHSNDMVGVVTEVAFHSYFGVVLITRSGYVSVSSCEPSRSYTDSTDDEKGDEDDTTIRHQASGNPLGHFHNNSHQIFSSRVNMLPVFIEISIEESVKFAIWLPITADPRKHILAVVVSGATTDSIKLLKFTKIRNNTSNLQSSSNLDTSQSNSASQTRVIMSYRRSLIVKETIDSMLYCPTQHCLYLGTSGGLRVLSMRCLDTSTQSISSRYSEPCLGVTQGFGYVHSTNLHVPITALCTSLPANTGTSMQQNNNTLYSSAFTGLRNGRILMLDDRDFSVARVCRVDESRLNQLTIATMPACLDSIALLSDGVSLLALDRTAKLSLFDIRRPRMELLSLAPATKLLGCRRFMLPTYGRDSAVALAHPSQPNAVSIYSLSSGTSMNSHFIRNNGSLISQFPFPINDQIRSVVRLGLMYSMSDDSAVSPAGVGPWSGLCAVASSSDTTAVLHIY